MENCNLHLTSKVALGLALASIAGACATRKFGENAGVKHAESTFLAKESLTQGWADVTRESHTKLLSIFNVVDKSNTPLNSDHIIAKRVQYWMDKIDTIYRNQVGEKAAGIPKPKAFIIDSVQENAFVAPVVICIEKPVVAKSFADKSEKVAPYEPGIIADDSAFMPGSMFNYDSTKFCTPASDTFTPEKVVAYLKLTSPQCNVTYSGSRFIIDDACVPMLGNGAISPRLGVMTTSNQISYFTKLMKTVTSEAEFVSVIAHELGHYYGAHVTYGLKSFVYQQKGKKNESKRPTELRIHSGLLADGLAAERITMSTGDFDETFKTVLSKTVAKAMSFDNILISASALKIDSCRRAQTQLGNLQKVDFDWTFNKKTPLISRNVHYPAFEKEFVACAKEVKIANSTVDAILAKTPAISLEITAMILAGSYRDLIKTPKGPLIKTVWDGITDLQKQLDTISARLEPAKKELHAKNLGVYTTEQEADDFAVDMISKLGIDVKSSVNANMDLVKMAAKTPMEPPYDKVFPKEDPVECAKKLNDEWHKNGVYQFENLGALIDTHHSSCYRVFNASREVLAHNYPAGGSIDETKTPGGTWADILKLPVEGFKVVPEPTPAEKEAAKQKYSACVTKAISLNISISICTL